MTWHVRQMSGPPYTWPPSFGREARGQSLYNTLPQFRWSSPNSNHRYIQSHPSISWISTLSRIKTTCLLLGTERREAWGYGSHWVNLLTCTALKDGGKEGIRFKKFKEKRGKGQDSCGLSRQSPFDKCTPPQALTITPIHHPKFPKYSHIKIGPANERLWLVEPGGHFGKKDGGVLKKGCFSLLTTLSLFFFFMFIFIFLSFSGWTPWGKGGDHRWAL